MMDRDDALAADAADPLAGFRREVVIDDPELIYLDGNSLGRLPVRAVDAVRAVVEDDWARGLVRSWAHWIDWTRRTGDLLAPLLGAGPGEVVISDQTSVNLYKLATAALSHTGRTDIVTSSANFPSDLYVLGGVATAAGGSLHVVETDPAGGPEVAEVAAALGERVGVVSMSHVAYKSGAITDMDAITAAAHEAGAMTLWDLSHSAGAIPVALGACNADLAVGCTYKHLNGGPGAPAFLYVRRDLQEALTQPIRGWFGHSDMFGFSREYVPAPDIRRFTVGTPPIISLAAARSGIELTAAAGIEAIREKGSALTQLIVDRFDARLAPLGFRLGSPRDPARRGGHVGLCHDDGYRMTKALIDRGVVPDFREPDTIRFGVAPLYNRFVEVWDGVEKLAAIAETGAHETYSDQRSTVT
jgi:kynureninase